MGTLMSVRLRSCGRLIISHDLLQNLSRDNNEQAQHSTHQTSSTPKTALTKAMSLNPSIVVAMSIFFIFVRVS